MREYVLYRDLPRERAVERIAAILKALPTDTAWKVTVDEHKPKRSDQQNRYLWGVVYATILREGGEGLAGWDAEDLHEFFLGEHFGWEEVRGFGTRRKRPIRRSSRLNKQEFSDYVAYIQRRMAELGVYIPDANEAEHMGAAA